jgi:hypothetical protein
MKQLPYNRQKRSVSNERKMIRKERVSSKDECVQTDLSALHQNHSEHSEQSGQSEHSGQSGLSHISKIENHESKEQTK